MLVYHPAYDAYHCVFRALLVTAIAPNLEVERLRILDFFLCFPSQLSNIQLPRPLAHARRLAVKMTNPYHGPVSMVQTFRDMEHIQIAAFRTLVASEVFQATSYERGLIERTANPLPDDLRERLAKAFARDSEIVDIVVGGLGALPLQGVGGLKHRTGLLEHRYDVA